MRFVSKPHGKKLYSEFTQLVDWNFVASDIFVDVFGVDADPGQLVNLVNSTSAQDLEFYWEKTKRQFQCAGANCT